MKRRQKQNADPNFQLTKGKLGNQGGKHFKSQPPRPSEVVMTKVKKQINETLK